jgi:hypothetical protein
MAGLVKIDKIEHEDAAYNADEEIPFNSHGPQARKVNGLSSTKI